jgi:L-amino acid N-acyltransferase YncA
MTLIRDAWPEDASGIARIYGHYALTTAYTFEETPPSVAEMAERMARITGAGLPYLVAEKSGAVAGYAYASPFHTRSAYRFTVENSVYIAPEHARQGLGTALMRRLISDCADRGYCQMIARVGDAQNTASLKLHQLLGFREVGQLRAVGLKFGGWVDVVELQLPLLPPRDVEG